MFTSLYPTTTASGYALTTSPLSDSEQQGGAGVQDGGGQDGGGQDPPGSADLVASKLFL